MTGGRLVRSSEYFRAQARLYRDIAQMMLDQQASQRAMAFATEYLERAEELGTAGADRIAT
jgi:hypothetical protein